MLSDKEKDGNLPGSINDTINLVDKPAIASGRLTRCRMGDFLKQDIENPVVLPLYPSSQHHTNYPLKNLKMYQTMEFPFYSFDTAAVKAMKTIATIGSEVPVVVFEIPRNLDSLKLHWSRWMPYYKECTDIRLLNDDNLAKIDDGSLFTLLPCEQIPAQKHTIDPDTFYEIYSKAFIPKIEIKQPRDMNKKEAKAPCVIKVPVSQGGTGVNIVTTDREILEYEECVAKRDWKGELIYQELLTDIVADRGIQAYLRKDGSVHLGCTYVPSFNDSGKWSGAIYYSTQEVDPTSLRLIRFCQPALKKLRDMGYFGYVSFDVIETRSSELFLLDINPRLGGSNQHMSMMDGMADKGFPVSMYEESLKLTITVKELISRADFWNNSKDSVVIVLAAQATENDTLLTAISLFAKNKDHLLSAQNDVFGYFRD
ncbi:unnamed protein product [Owenia fusiformis]|uniref:ATP-grasp domain-containing protein n=1 Tax=Owenia fusiformis TaxID=6347 RepID=A0A8S4Q7M6_OWEFU|nr:unnamed protein product [Owenia fusiformis]